jgi:hypothetical protein
MGKLPFSVYDFFGYLASSFLLFAAVDHAFDGGRLLGDSPKFMLGLLWLVVAYIAGHLIAHVSSVLLEQGLVRRVLRSPEETLFQERPCSAWARLFPGFYRPFPKEIRERVLVKAHEQAGIAGAGRALFFHCHTIAKRDQATLGRLNSFLNLYGFCRNSTLALSVAAAVLIAGALFGGDFGKLWWAAAALVGSVGMFYRYLKFFKLYTEEVFRTYAES